MLEKRAEGGPSCKQQRIVSLPKCSRGWDQFSVQSQQVGKGRDYKLVDGVKEECPFVLRRESSVLHDFGDKSE